MENSTDAELICTNCDNDIIRTDEFCRNCGNLFREDVECKNHTGREAEGVCIICGEPYCGKCAGWTNSMFLCGEHEGYEIYQGMARVFGTCDDSLAQYVYKCLSDAGLHPYLYSRKASPLSLGGVNYNLYRASGDYDGHIINEVKVMVPCSEVKSAEKILAEFDLPK